ncbi:MAG: hypothetical protein CMF50_06340 [Legionellales bacterium]|nr:hypothetical protein [Legionellales bacterium]
MKSNPSQKFSLKDFVDLDNSNNAEFLIESMKLHAQLEPIKEIKRTAVKMLDLQLGDNVIELGCGLGYDTRMMAEIVGMDGIVMGIDLSHKMLTEARKLTQQTNILYRKADANQLDFDDNTFSALRADRLLVSQQDVNHTLSEAIRVVKPGGKLCITSLDLGSMILSPYLGAITDSVIKYWQELVLNPFVGRQLPGLFKQHGLVDVEVKPQGFYVDSLESLNKIIKLESMLEDMNKQGLLSDSDLAEVSTALNKADVAGSLFWGITMVTVLGVKN